MVPVFNENVWERFTGKDYHSVNFINFLSFVSKFFEKLVNNRLDDHLEKFGLFVISSD